jgi:hypothetical protein
MTATQLDTTYHRDGSVTLWDVYSQQWVRTDAPSDEVYASLSASERARIMRHIAATEGK